MKKKTDKKPVIEMGDMSADLLAESIVDVAKSAKRLLNSKLSTRAIYLLIKDDSGVPIDSIKKVLNSAAELDKYVKR